MGGGGGGAPIGGGQQSAAAPADGAAQAKAEAPKEEEKKEKSHYDIELTKFDPAKKISLIKEVRALFGLGLKEAKEMVESAPVWVKKECKKEDAEKIEAKIKEFGGEVRMV